MSSKVGRIVGVAALVVAVLILGGYVVRGLYTGYWNLQISNTNHQNTVNQQNWSTQNGYQTAISNDVAAATSDIAQMPGAANASALKVEAINAGDQACMYALKLVPSALAVPDDMQKWIKGNCSAGALSLQSPIRNGSGN